MSLEFGRRAFLGLVAQGLTAMLAGCRSTDASTAGDASTTKAVTDVKGQLQAIFLKAGKADAIILRTDNSCVVVDTGTEEKSDKLCETLSKLGVDTIDALIITHFDKDHVGGADGVIESFKVKQVFSTYKSKDSDEIEEYDLALKTHSLVPQVVGKKTQLAFDNVSYTLIPPARDDYGSTTSNDSSIVTRVEYGATSMLLTGDIERSRIDEILASGIELRCDVLKVPHHGRAEKNSAAFAQATHPAYAVITSSKSEKEDKEVVEAYKGVGAEVYLTREGTVTAKSDGKSVVLTQ